MKKTLIALAVTAFAASASAVTVYDNEGSKIDVDGSLRLILEKTSKKAKDDKGAVVAGTHKNESALRNAGTRFGVKAKHQLGEDFYALGRLEFRFDDTDSEDKFGRVYAKRAYVGLGSNAAGELTFGRQVTIVDDMSQTTDYEYGLIPKGDYAQDAGTQVIRYDYKGIEGLQAGVGYSFNQKNDEKGKALDDAIKNAVHAGVIFARDAYDFRLGYGHTNYETGTAEKHRKDGYFASASYAFGDFKVIGDFGYAHEKNGKDKTKKFYVAPGFEYQVVPASKVYGNYIYEHVKSDADLDFIKTKSAKDAYVKADGSGVVAAAEAEYIGARKTKMHGVLLGVDYQFHKQVIAYVEGAVTRTKGYDKDGKLTGKSTDKVVGVGMRVYW